jgi:AcrR family transcriptional regulator
MRPARATQSDADATHAIDGRQRRSARSRQAIVQSLFALVGSGVLQPTAQQVAETAGVGIRSVFRHFADMDSLFAEMDARLQADAVPILRTDPVEGPLDRRARALVDHRGDFFERIAPYKRSSNIQRWRSEFLRERHGLLVRALRSDLLRWLPELRRAPAGLVDALDLALSFEAWDRLRTDQRLSRDRARDALLRTVLALVAGLSRKDAHSRADPQGKRAAS